MTAAETGTARPPALRHRVMAGYIGNVVEWYDFALYGYLAGIIAPVFFPPENPTAGLIATYGIFAAGFMMRPLGAAVFGWFGDRFGRARTMQISVTLMEAFTTNRHETLLALAFAASYGTCFYLAFVYLPEWLASQGLMDRGTALYLAAASALALVALVLTPDRSRGPLR